MRAIKVWRRAQYKSDFTFDHIGGATPRMVQNNPGQTAD
jgi:hypothetical protein